MPWPPSLEVIHNGRQMYGVTYAPGAGLQNLPWPLLPDDLLTLTYVPQSAR